MKLGRKIKPLIDRFNEKYHPEPNTGCWIWTASLDGHGYGHIQGGNTHQMRAAHRVSYETFRGPIPKGLYIDHQCNNKLCVNPYHLKAMTNRENLLRGNTLIAAQVKRTHCPRGHEYSGVYKGKRNCRKCNAIVANRRYHQDLALAHRKRKEWRDRKKQVAESYAIY